MALLPLILALLGFATTQPTDAPLPSDLDLEIVRSLPTQHDGRWPPLDTLARETVESVTGETFFHGHDPVLLLLAWTFDAKTWQERPLISIGSAQLRQELQLPADQTMFSFADLSRQGRLRELGNELSRRDRNRKLNPLESKVSDIYDELSVLRETFSGRQILLIPDADEIGGAWRPITARPAGHPVTSDDAVITAWEALRDAFVKDDPAAFQAASVHVRDALAALPAAHRPSPQLIATELRYNRLRPFRKAWIVMAAGAGLAALAMAVRRKWFDILTILTLAAGFGILTYGLSLRWQIAGRIPAANMFESLLFLSWGAGAFAIISLLAMRDRLVPLTASAIGALALILADCLPLDHYVRPIAPVLLDTVWMSIHVPIIMVSYAVLALAVLIAHLQLLTMAIVPRRRDIAESIDRLHYWYVHIGAILLTAGIITGSMWGASSWGRYWGWDPKEVWSLVACLGYLAILHVRVDHEKVPAWVYVAGIVMGVAVFTLVASKLAPLTPVKLGALSAAAVAVVIFVLARGMFATALKSVLAFWLIIMTYVGVNYVLGIGLHSYAFGTGGVVIWMYRIAAIDLALIGACSIVYLTMRKLLAPERAGTA